MTSATSETAVVDVTTRPMSRKEEEEVVHNILHREGRQPAVIALFEGIHRSLDSIDTYSDAKERFAKELALSNLYPGLMVRSSETNNLSMELQVVATLFGNTEQEILELSGQCTSEDKIEKKDDDSWTPEMAQQMLTVKSAWRANDFRVKLGMVRNYFELCKLHGIQAKAYVAEHMAPNTMPSKNIIEIALARKRKAQSANQEACVVMTETLEKAISKTVLVRFFSCSIRPKLLEKLETDSEQDRQFTEKLINAVEVYVLKLLCPHLFGVRAVMPTILASWLAFDGLMFDRVLDVQLPAPVIASSEESLAT